MVKQTHNMSEEKKPNIKRVLPEGWLPMTIESCEPSVSKAGNQMMVIGLNNEEENYTETIYLVAEQGKRWMLKKLLTACGIAAGKDNVYEWDTEEIIGKKINALNILEDNVWIDRSGEERKTQQNRFTDFDEIAWDDDK